MRHFQLLLLILCSSVFISRCVQSDSLEMSNSRFAIIAGTQKSGTTVLAALLAQHPSVRFTKYKELHFFDRAKNYVKGIEWYLKQFPNARASSSNEQTVLAEATPFYVASREACERNARALPHAKLIVLLREPVDRAYSEYQMKRRRVEEQTVFFQRLSEHEKNVYRCLIAHPHDFDAVAQCIPESISAHSRWPKLVAALKKSEKVLKNWNAAVNGCFPARRNGAELTSEYTVSQSGYIYRAFDRALSSVTQVRSYPSHNPVLQAERESYCTAGMTDRSLLQSTAHNTSSCSPSAKQYEYLPVFNASSCWRYDKEGLERIKTLREAFMGEIDAFQVCAAPYLRNITAVESEKDPSGVRRWTDTYLAALDHAVDACLKVRGGISTQYFYRSMYAVQLHRCYQSIPPDKVLVIPSGRLRREPSQVLSEVLAFVNLPPLEEGSRADAEVGRAAVNNAHSIDDAIKEHFPRFAVSTGWRVNSEYAPMPGYLAQYMQDFFAMHNQLLFNMLGQDITSQW